MIDDSTRVRVIMALLGITSKELAERIGVTQNAVTGWSKGRFSPRQRSRTALAEICYQERILFLPSGMPIFADDFVPKQESNHGEGVSSSV